MCILYTSFSAAALLHFSNIISCVLPLSGNTTAIKNQCVSQHSRHFLTYWPWCDLLGLLEMCLLTALQMVSFHSCSRYTLPPWVILSHTTPVLCMFFFYVLSERNVYNFNTTFIIIYWNY